MSRSSRFLVSSLFALSAAACATTQPAPTPQELPIWPLPPEPTRIRFVEDWNGQRDVEAEKGFWAGVAEVFAGDAPDLVLKKPYTASGDAQGRILVADTGLGRLAVFDPAANAFSLWGETGSGALQQPTGVTTDEDGRVYVADAATKRVVCFEPDGRYLRAYGRAGELTRPAGVAVFGGKLYVVDTGGHRVAVFDAESTKKLRDIGERGSGAGQFNFPTNIDVDADGRLYVMDTMNFRVQIFGPDGQFEFKFGRHCDMPGCFARSKGIAVDSEGHIYVADAAFNVVQIFDRQGRLLMAFGGAGHGPGKLWLPAGLSIDHRDRIYVADQYNWRINVYQYVAQQPEGDTASEAVVKEIDPGAAEPAEAP